MVRRVLLWRGCPTRPEEQMRVRFRVGWIIPSERRSVSLNVFVDIVNGAEESDQGGNEPS